MRHARFKFAKYFLTREFRHFAGKPPAYCLNKCRGNMIDQIVLRQPGILQKAFIRILGQDELFQITLKITQKHFIVL